MGSDRDKLLLGGRPWLGVNFWSRAGGPGMWRSYDPEVVRAELATLAAHGMNLTRSFCFWPDFHPEPERLDEDVLARFADFLDAHDEAGMGTVPTFIVGHMSGENWDPAWRQGRDLYGDVWMVARQAWFVRQLTRRFAGHPAVAGWLLSNEMPLYGGPASEPAVTAWAELLVQAVRAGGGTQPVSLGDGAWGIETSGVDNGFSLRATAPLVDFVGPHVYPMDSDRVRLHLAPAFACELAGVAGRPVVLEEFGVSSGFSSAEQAGHHYRQVLHTSLLAGASGWLAWNNTDLDHLADQDPYRHHPFELHFGLTDHTGAPKPQLAEVRAFAELLEEVDFPNLSRPPAEAALVVASYLEHPYPFTEPADRTFVLDSLRQAYVAAWEADVAVRPMRERDGLEPGRRLYLVPSAKQLTAPGWRARSASPATAPSSTSPGAPAATASSAAPGTPAWTACSPSSTSSPTDSSTPSRMRRWSSLSCAISGRSPKAADWSCAPAATSMSARSCSSGRSPPRSSPSTSGAGRCCWNAPPAAAGRCCAPTRWSRSRRPRPGSIPSRPGGSTTRWPPWPASAVR